MSGLQCRSHLNNNVTIYTPFLLNVRQYNFLKIFKENLVYIQKTMVNYSKSGECVGKKRIVISICSSICYSRIRRVSDIESTVYSLQHRVGAVDTE